MEINKKLVIQGFLDVFERELAELIKSAKAAHEAATHEEVKAEDRHDTQAIEASYLAAGQATRVSEIEKMIAEYRTYLDALDTAHPKISLGSIVTLQQLSSNLQPILKNKDTHSFIAERGGGTQIQLNGKVITVITPRSPIGEPLMDAGPGEEIVVEAKSGIREYKVLSCY